MRQITGRVYLRINFLKYTEMKSDFKKEWEEMVDKYNIPIFSELSDVIENPPINMSVGQHCTFVNCYGVEFTGHTILGFCAPQENIATGESTGRCVYIDFDCYWMPVRPEQLIITD